VPRSRTDTTVVRIRTSIRNLWGAAICLSLLPAPAPAAVPDGFVGAMLDGPAATPGFGRARLARELDVMRSSGVETVRVAWSWEYAQPYVSWAAVPESERRRFRDVEGLPLAIAPLDELVSLAARRGLRVFPVTVHTPSWNVRQLLVDGSPPRDPEPYGPFMRALVSRYGGNGAFWREHPELPRLPIRWWQLWNEPHLSGAWAGPRWESEYAALLRVGARAVHRADRRARVVLAGITSDDVPVWDNLDAILAEGVGPEVDLVAAHVFTRRPNGVVRALERVRGTLRAYGLGRMPLGLTEWAWPSSRGRRPGGRLSWETTPRGQAARVGATLRLLGRARRRLGLRTAIHYTWLAPDRGRAWARWSGLRRIEPDGSVVAKPALAAFRRAALALRSDR
jgi:hypothetical protein